MNRYQPGIGLLAACLLQTVLFQTSALAVAPAQNTAQWQELFTEDGLTVSTLVSDENELPTFRAEGTFNENLYDILAVLDDVPRHTDWLPHMEESHTVEQTSDLDRVLYYRFDVPWPVSDRDAGVRVLVNYSRPTQSASLKFLLVTHEDVPEIDGVIRIARLDSEGQLQYLTDNKTQVQFQIFVEPAGWLPNWVVQWVVEGIPLKLMRNLRKQIAQTQGHYLEFLQKFEPPASPAGGAVPLAQAQETPLGAPSVPESRKSHRSP